MDIDSDAPIRISLSHASERGLARLRALVDAIPGAGGFARGSRLFEAHALPRIEGDTLVVPRPCARETWATLFRSDDPRLLAIAFRLFGEIQARGWVAGLWRSEWDRPEPWGRSSLACGPRRPASAVKPDVRRPRGNGTGPDTGTPPPKSVA